MLYLIHCYDGPDGLDHRAKLREGHFAYLEERKDHLVLAGPTLAEENGKPTGSVLVVEFDNLAEATAFAEGDPYKKGGVFQTVTIQPYKIVLPKEDVVRIR